MRCCWNFASRCGHARLGISVMGNRQGILSFLRLWVRVVGVQRVGEAQRGPRCTRALKSRPRGNAGAGCGICRACPAHLPFVGAQGQVVRAGWVFWIMWQRAVIGAHFKSMRSLQRPTALKASWSLLQGHFLDLHSQRGVFIGLWRGRSRHRGRHGGHTLGASSVVLVEVRFVFRRQQMQHRFGVVAIILLAHIAHCGECWRRWRREDGGHWPRLRGLQDFLLDLALDLRTKTQSRKQSHHKVADFIHTCDVQAQGFILIKIKDATDLIPTEPRPAKKNDDRSDIWEKHIKSCNNWQRSERDLFLKLEIYECLHIFALHL